MFFVSPGIPDALTRAFSPRGELGHGVNMDMFSVNYIGVEYSKIK